MKFEVTILGCSSATPTKDRHPSAQVVNIGDMLMLVDCGEATQNQMLHFKVSHSRINHIFISHLHADHYLGLMGLLATINFQGRTSELNVFGPEPLEEIIRMHFKYSDTFLKFPLKFNALSHGSKELILEEKHFRVYKLPLLHRIPTNGFLFEEKKPQRKINPTACNKYEVPFTFYDALKEGKDYTDPQGNIISNDTLTFPNSKTRRYAYCSDTLFEPSLAPLLDEPELLYHESTFMHELRERAQETFHSTAQEAGQLAQMAGAKKLLLGHFSARYEDLTPLLQEARSQFAESYLALEGERFAV